MNTHSSLTISSQENQGPLKIAGLYLLIGGLWVLFSDRLAAQITSAPALLTRISLYTGWGYVLITALLLYWLMRRQITALRGGEEQLRLITDALPALISYVDSDKRYRFSNKAYEDWFGHQAHGKRMEEVLGTIAYKTISRYIDSTMKGETVSYETEIPYKDGGTRFVNATYVPDLSTNGHVKGFFSLVQDITGSKQAEEELRQWADAFEGCAHGIAIDDPSTNRIVVCNPAFAKMHKCRVEEVIGTAILSLYAPQDREHVRRSIEKADQIGHSRFEARSVLKDGSTFPVQMDVVSVWGDDGELLHRVATLVDISEQKGAEESLRESESNARSLLRLSKRLEQAQTYSEALNAALEEVKTILGYQNVWTYLLSEDKQYLRLLTITGEKSQEVTGDFPTFTIKGDRFLEEIAQGQDIVLVEDARIDPRTNKDIVAQLGNRTIVNVPIILMDTYFGAFGTGSFGEEGVRIPTPKQLEYLRALASHMAVTLDRIHLLAARKQAEEALQRVHNELELKIQERTAALSQANALLQALLDYMPDHIYFKDTQCRFIRSSKSQVDMLGLSDPAQIVGKTDFDFFPHATQAYAEEQEVMRTGQALVDFEERVVWPDSRETWVSTTKVPLRTPDAQIIGIFGISRDITERKRGGQAIQQLNADLKKQAAQLEAANKELEAFSYSVSHDLRAPLRAIDGFTRILLEDYEPMLDEEGKRVCTIISREAQHMGQLIDDLLAFSRLGRKEMHPAKIDMKAVAGSVFAELVTREDAERIDFHVHRLPPASGDATLIRQAWVNLLSNAIKFSSKKERAVIEVGSKHTENENVYYVRDNGAGFDNEYVDKLFGVFQRLHSEKEFTGTGVGLAIVKRVINRHGGRVWAEAEVDKGATFYFALPRKRE